MNYAIGITNAVRGKLINFFNPIDFALNLWRENQAFAADPDQGHVTMKPNTLFGYSTDSTNSVLQQNYWNQLFASIFYGGYYGNRPTHTVTDPKELMPFVSRPHSLAVGASSGIHGQISGELDLQDELNFGNAYYDHSGEFNRNIQDLPTWPFYSQLKTNLFSKP